MEIKIHIINNIKIAEVIVIGRGDGAVKQV